VNNYKHPTETRNRPPSVKCFPCGLPPTTSATTSANTMLVITRIADGKTLEKLRATVTRLTREELMMGDEPSEPTSYISQNQPVQVHIDADGAITIINKQPLLLCRDGTLRTHHGDLKNVQASDRVCFCPMRITGRDYATFLFTLTTGFEEEAVDEEDVSEHKRAKGYTIQDQSAPGEFLTWDDDEVLPRSEWRTKKRKLQFDSYLPAASSSRGKTKCGNCKRTGHNTRTCCFKRY